MFSAISLIASLKAINLDIEKLFDYLDDNVTAPEFKDKPAGCQQMRFMTLIEVHQRAFTITKSEVNILEALARNTMIEHPWMMEGRLDKLMESLAVMQDRSEEGWEWIFGMKTDATKDFAYGVHGEEMEKYARLVQIHASEEASEVIKEVCKDQRNNRLLGKNTLSELADMQAMIYLYMQTMSIQQIIDFKRQAEMMANKKRVVIAAEVKEQNDRA